MQETPEEKELHLKNKREKSYVKRIQETPEEKELHFKRTNAKRLQETVEQKEVHLKNAQKKRETVARQKSLKQKDSLKISNNHLLLAPSMNQLSLQVMKIGGSLNQG